jgi:AhpD family alkylhydroperoxidase
MKVDHKESNMKNFVEHYQELGAWMEKLGQSLPNVMQGFGSMHEAAIADGALDSKTKELIALGIAITVRCDGCISYHVHDALAGGASKEQIAETVGMAILMGGGPSVVYGIEAMQAVEQFEKSGL